MSAPSNIVQVHDALWPKTKSGEIDSSLTSYRHIWLATPVTNRMDGAQKHVQDAQPFEPLALDRLAYHPPITS